MSRSAFSVIIHGFFMNVVGVVTVIHPDWMLNFFLITGGAASLMRFLGIIFACSGFYYFLAARHEFVPFFYASVVVRYLVALFLASLVVSAGESERLLILVGVDMAMATWTLVELVNWRKLFGPDRLNADRLN